VAKYEADAFDDAARTADLLQEYEARIAALERMVGYNFARRLGVLANEVRPHNLIVLVLDDEESGPIEQRLHPCDLARIGDDGVFEASFPGLGLTNGGIKPLPPWCCRRTQGS